MKRYKAFKICQFTENVVHQHSVDSVGAGEDPGGDDVEVSDGRCADEHVYDGDDGEEGVLVERHEVFRLPLGGEEAPEGPRHTDRKGRSNGVEAGEDAVQVPGGLGERRHKRIQRGP